MSLVPSPQASFCICWQPCGRGRREEPQSTSVFSQILLPLPLGWACYCSSSVRKASSLSPAFSPFPLPVLLLSSYSSCVSYFSFPFTSSPTLYLSFHCKRSRFILGPEGKGQRLESKKGLALESRGLGFSPEPVTDALRVLGNDPSGSSSPSASKVFGLVFPKALQGSQVSAAPSGLREHCTPTELEQQVQGRSQNTSRSVAAQTHAPCRLHQV